MNDFSFGDHRECTSGSKHYISERMYRFPDVTVEGPLKVSIRMSHNPQRECVKHVDGHPIKSEQGVDAWLWFTSQMCIFPLTLCWAENNTVFTEKTISCATWQERAKDLAKSQKLSIGTQTNAGAPSAFFQGGRAIPHPTLRVPVWAPWLDVSFLDKISTVTSGLICIFL